MEYKYFITTDEDIVRCECIERVAGRIKVLFDEGETLLDKRSALFFNTFEEAKNFLLSRANNEIGKIKQRIEKIKKLEG